eukprot:CAMPEP_0115726478 /NCGR_PEP_ID=MMETSP0272-20121206/81897_1 /TAXON_ID=71861 /ORGANISM="Scrippsiella trochoidea, Strain CCMP3099" /LENGTH=153 /DNA_ID=CAMNT_0003169899 /DNA_START=122 /DNA_END=579 /DNA_ORIENTATION=+
MLVVVACAMAPALADFSGLAAASSVGSRSAEDSNATAAILKAYQEVLGDGAVLFEELASVLTKFAVVGWSVLSKSPDGQVNKEASLLLTTIQQMIVDLRLDNIARGNSDSATQISSKLAAKLEMPNPPSCLVNLGGIVSALTSARWNRLQGRV